ncbi:replication protein [Macrococcus sp. DPC7161]|uniref:replication protein n=1 Tax=Macrococcus sp. DPC7161 TaxID=2507060 RepID=UPI00100A9F92|nr:replication protein [Macrococcus sp. DPC7161]RXK19062.1 replication protein [Macrococcus sp. DPC7161]
MNNRDYISSIITQFSGRNNIIPIPVIYLEITEDYPSAALLNQMIYWSDKTSRKDGYFYKTYNEWFEELHLTEYQVRRATKKLNSLGFVETALKKANGAPTLHYKVDTTQVSEWILKKLKNGNLTNLRMETEETQESLTEITTEITTENNISASKNAQDSQLINEFNEWYELYNKKKDRKAAFTKFKTARKKHTFEVIMKGTKEYLKTITNKQYQKYPKTFLHNESYLEDYSDSYVNAEPLTGNIFDELRNEYK